MPAQGLLARSDKRLRALVHDRLPWLQRRGVGVCSADDQRSDALRRVFCQAKADPSPHGVPKVMRVANGEGVQDGGHIGHPQWQGVRGGLVWLRTRSMPTRIDQNKLVVSPQYVTV